MLEVSTRRIFSRALQRRYLTLESLCWTPAYLHERCGWPVVTCSCAVILAVFLSGKQQPEICNALAAAPQISEEMLSNSSILQNGVAKNGSERGGRKHLSIGPMVMSGYYLPRFSNKMDTTSLCYYKIRKSSSRAGVSQPQRWRLL